MSKFYRNKPNKIVLKTKYALLYIYGIENLVRMKVKFDLEDVPRISQYNWCALDKRNLYLICRGVGSLHRFLLNCPVGKLVDHRDGNTLDCRKKNLRICTHKGNNRNAGLSSANTTGMKGVSLSKSGKFKVFIYKNNKAIYVGLFDNLIAAAEAYNQAAIKHHGKFARLNNLSEVNQ
jgi:hypothetical protein